MAQKLECIINNPMELLGRVIVPIREGENMGYREFVRSITTTDFYIRSGYSLPYFYTEEKVSYYVPKVESGSGPVKVSDCIPLRFSNQFKTFLDKYKKLSKSKYDAEKKRLIASGQQLPESYLHEEVHEDADGRLISNISEGSDEDYRTTVMEDMDRGGTRYDSNGYELGFYPGKYSDP